MRVWKVGFVGSLALLLAVLAACESGSLPANGADAAATQDLGGSGPHDAPASTLHEWGTLTSVQSWQGAWLGGAHHREEALPAFLPLRDVGPAGSAAKQTFPGVVSTLMQAPVLSVQSDIATQLRFELSMPAGLFVAAWPPPSAQAPATVTDLAGGTLRFDLEVEPGQSVDAAVGGEAAALWAPLRSVPSASVRVGSDREQFVFWRGVSAWQPPVRVRTEGVAGSLQVHFHNDGDDAIPAAFWVHVHAGGGLIKALGAVPPKTSRTATTTPKEIRLDRFSEQATAEVTAALQQAGLSPVEAAAMVQSWGANYFKTPGLRVLWLVPRAWIDAAMPAQATPTPTEHLRVYVGRLEGLSTDDRNRAQAAVEAVGQRGAAASVADLGHFAEARLRALRPELTEPLATQCDALIAEALLVP